MSPYRAIGGMVVADHGPIRLKEARALIASYAREAEESEGCWRALCADRAQTLADAVEHARAWRRAAGWSDPDQADREES